jgi:hypothetical protein
MPSRKRVAWPGCYPRPPGSEPPLVSNLGDNLSSAASRCATVADIGGNAFAERAFASVERRESKAPLRQHVVDLGGVSGFALGLFTLQARAIDHQPSGSGGFTLCSNLGAAGVTDDLLAAAISTLLPRALSPVFATHSEPTADLRPVLSQITKLWTIA